MFSYFKYIDTNVVKDPTKDDSDGSFHSCVWFTIPMGTTVESDEMGIDSYKYHYFSFPYTARFDVEEDYVVSETDIPYIYNQSSFELYGY